jgi:hypothetical protein
MSSGTLIFFIQVLHTAVFAFISTCIAYVVYCGVTGRASKWLLRSCIAIPAAAGLVWRLNGSECPLASIVYRLSGGDGSIPDLLLPVWLSRWIMTGSTLIICFGVTLVLWRVCTHRWQAEDTR